MQRTQDAVPVTGRRLRVLVLASTFPFPPVSGVDMRNAQIIRQIASRHDVTLLTYARPIDDPAAAQSEPNVEIKVVQRAPESRLRKRLAQLRSLGSPLPYACLSVRSQEMQATVDQLTRATRFDLIHLESCTMSCLRLPDGVPVVVDEHNIEYELYRRLFRGERGVLRRFFNGMEFLRMRRFERSCWRRVQACCVTSEREEPVVRGAAPGTLLTVAPNGVDLDYFTPSDEEPVPSTVAFVGVLNYRPNADAATYLVDEVWPLVLAQRPDANLTIIGMATEREAAALSRPRVEVAGRVPDVRPYLHAAAVIAVPVRMGSGTRLKVVEALSMGKAIVSTSLGCEGIATSDGQHLLIADDAATFAARIVELFDDAGLRHRLGRSGRTLAEESYSWDVAGHRLEALYARALPDSETDATVNAATDHTRV